MLDLKSLLTAPIRIDLFVALSQLDDDQKSDMNVILDAAARIVVRYIDEVKKMNREENRTGISFEQIDMIIQIIANYCLEVFDDKFDQSAYDKLIHKSADIIVSRG